LSGYIFATKATPRMVDIQSPTAEIRRGKKEIRRKKETGRKYICPHPAMQGSHKEIE